MDSQGLTRQKRRHLERAFLRHLATAAPYLPERVHRDMAETGAVYLWAFLCALIGGSSSAQAVHIARAALDTDGADRRAWRNLHDHATEVGRKLGLISNEDESAEYHQAHGPVDSERARRWRPRISSPVRPPSLGQRALVTGPMTTDVPRAGQPLCSARIVPNPGARGIATHLGWSRRSPVLSIDAPSAGLLPAPPRGRRTQGSSPGRGKAQRA